MKSKSWSSIQIPADKEASHQIRMGDTGVGKTSLTHQDLLDAEANNTCCVVNDAKGGEILARFYKPERGDVILNPTDARCAYWNISSEGYDLATYKTVMTSLFPPPIVRDPIGTIFNQWTTSLGAYLLDQFRPDTETFGAWIANYPSIERRVKGTIHQYTLPENSPNQRAGVLGNLALAGDPLWMMPTAKDGRPEFCIRKWVQDPKGWVFISSDANTRDALKPLISMWMDLFILGLLSSKTTKRVKLIYDELHTLQTLTRLHDGITMLRSPGHQIIASVQNQEQIKHLYGDQTRTILSQAYTKWIFATSDPDSADILERIGGKRKILRLEQTHSHGTWFYERDRNSSRVVEVQEPAISATQIKGMSDKYAYFVQRGFKNKMVVVPVEIPYVDLPERHPPYVKRVVPPRNFQLPPDAAAVQADGAVPASSGSYEMNPMLTR
jgi:Type IV secretion-system coupling protein DNA-binding domain